MDELAQTSDAIFTATFVISEAQWAARTAYGHRQRYVEHYRFRVRITGWLKETPKLPAKGKLWIGYRGDPIPGKWMIVEELYETSFQPREAKPGDKIVVFASSREIEGWDAHAKGRRAEIQARAIDTEACLAGVKAALARAPAEPEHPDASPDR